MVDLTITHTFVDPKADKADTTLVRPSDWNATHTIVNGTGLATEASVTAVAASVTALANNYVTNTRFPNLRYLLIGVNANAVADNPITITLPTGATRFRVANISLINTGATASLTAAQYGIFSAAAGGGTAYVAAGAVLTGLTATGLSAAGAFANATNVGATIMFPSGTQFFFRITTGQGAAATIDVIFVIEPYP